MAEIDTRQWEIGWLEQECRRINELYLKALKRIRVLEGG